MSRNVALTLVCLLLAGFAFAAEAPVSAPPGTLSPEGPACQADPAAAMFSQLGLEPVFKGHDPATCGRCLHCASTNVCAGKLIGDVCSGTGGTCQAFDGCALYNCCRCANIQPVVVVSEE
ncbi:MAG TPA: hypothetical protein VF789_34510 [Thermoanaerobaculia bacterium]